MARRRRETPRAALVRLIFQGISQLLSLVTRMSLELIRDGVRLLFWSIRRYGWGPVSRIAAAGWGSLWLHDQLGWLALSTSSVSSVLIGTFTFWSGLHLAPSWLALGGRWAQEAWRRRCARVSSTRPVVSDSQLLPAVPPSQVPSPACPRTGFWSRIVSGNALREAWQRVLARGGGPGPDGITVEQFALDAERSLELLAAALKAGRYRASSPRWVEISKPNGGTRRLAVLNVQDRIVQQAILSTLTPIWDSEFAPCSYAYRPGRSALQAVAAVEKELAVGRVWVVDADIASFFDSVPHHRLFPMMQQWLPDQQLSTVVERCVTAGTPEAGRGLAQGAPLSPLLANLYLHRFDTALLESNHVLIRYADDLLLLCATRPQALDAFKTAERLLHGLQLRLNPEKTRIVHRDEGFTFLGYTFTREGKRPCEQAMDSLKARLEAADDEPARHRILAGWQGYFGGGQDTRQGDGNRQDSPSLPSDEEIVGAGAEIDSAKGSRLMCFRQWFVGRSDVFARYWEKNGRRGYAPVRRSLSDDALRAHLSGEMVLGTYLLGPEGRTRALVFDVDGRDTSENASALARRLAQRMVGALADHEISPLLVDSGGKGAHVWLCFKNPVEARAVRRWAERWLDRFRPFPDGVLVEIFPKQDGLAPGALGSLIRMPLGQHPQTGRWSRLLSPDGTLLADPWSVLAEGPVLTDNSLARTEEASHELPPAPGSITPVVEGCALLRGLAQKAATTHHLRHTERLALLYTLGHLGDAGHTYLHQIIALCSNYDPRITERWVQRLEAGHRPIRCATLKEWLKDYLPGVTCPCLPKAANPSPLDLLRPTRKRAARRAATPSPTTASGVSIDTHWQEVADEVFGETCRPDLPR